MKLARIRPSSEKAAILAFFLLIPVFMCYQAIAQLQIMPPVLGSYFTAATFLSFPISAYAISTSSVCRNFYRPLVFKLFASFLLLQSVVVISGLLLELDNQIAKYQLISITRFIALFIFVIAFDAENPRISRFIFHFIWIYSCFVIATSTDGNFVRPAFEIGEKYFELDYQMLAFSYILLLIYVLPSLAHWSRFFLYTTSIPALYLIGARSEFFAVFLLIFVVETIHLKTIIYWPLGLISVTFALVSLLAADLSSIFNTRIFSIFDTDADPSKNARKELTLNAARTIQESPILGNYASHEPGAYAHNILSAWVDLGILGFTLLITLLGLSLASLFANFRTQCRCVHYTRALSALTITMFLLIAAKTYTYSMVPVTVAFYCVWRLRRSIGIHPSNRH